MTNEQYIKSKLDGKFWAIQFSHGGEGPPRVKEYAVPLDYIPTFKAFEETEEAQTHQKKRVLIRKEWNDADDAALLNLRQDGARWEYVATALERCSKNCRARYAYLTAKHGITPVKCRRGVLANMPVETKAQIVALRDKEGLTWDEINARLGLTGYGARDYYHRRLRNLRERRLVA